MGRWFWDVPCTTGNTQYPPPSQISKNGGWKQAGMEQLQNLPWISSTSCWKGWIWSRDEVMETRLWDVLYTLPRGHHGEHPVPTQPQSLPKMGAGRDGAEPCMGLLQHLHEASKG